MSKNARASTSQVSLLNCVVSSDPNSAAMRLTGYSFGELSAMPMRQQQDALAKPRISVWRVLWPSPFPVGRGTLNNMTLLSSI